MTTVVRTRAPLETLSMSQQPAGRRRSERIAATYDEEDGDFKFTRAPKRKKTAPAALEPVPEPPAPQTAKRGRKRKDRDDEPVTTERKPRARKMSFSTPKGELDAIVVPKSRKSTRPSVGKTRKADDTQMEQTELDNVDMIGASAGNDPSRVGDTSVDTTKQSTVITLPFSDTPIINRNKEMRKKNTGSRRSSLGLRGRRASSLIDNGHSAIPHREVETAEFYKHIEAAGLSEPRRMRQLLTWTAERCLGEKPAHGEVNELADQAARTIKENLLKDFGNRSEFTDWFTREESAPKKVVMKPNPRNIGLEQNLAGLEARIKKLKEEREQWKILARTPPALPPLFPDDSEEVDPSQIDASLLDPEQAAILTSISSSSAIEMRTQISKQIRDVQSGLEFNVDQFADGVHKIEQYQQTAGRVADKILAISAARLDERDKREKEATGTRDLPMQEVLRSLSRILPESRSG